MKKTPKSLLIIDKTQPQPLPEPPPEEIPPSPNPRASSPPPKRPYHRHNIENKNHSEREHSEREHSEREHSEKEHILKERLNNVNKNINEERTPPKTNNENQIKKSKSFYKNLFLVYSPILENKSIGDYKESIFQEDGIENSIMIPMEFNLCTKEYYNTFMEIIKNHPGFTLYLFSQKTQRDWIRSIFRNNENKYLSQIWEAYEQTENPYHRINIFFYAWIYHNGGVIFKPWLIITRSLILIKHTLQYIDFPALNSPNSRKELIILFPTEKGYIDNNIIFSTKNHPFIYEILKTITKNIIRKQNSKTIYRHAHMDFETISGSISLTNEFFKHYHFPNIRIPQSGFISPNIGIMPLNAKNEIFKPNNEYYKNKELLEAVDISINRYHTK
jgi:hypothetical protein